MRQFSSVDEYINSLPDDVHPVLQKVRRLILSLDPDITETLSYGIPTYKLNGKNLVHIGGFRTHLSFFPTGEGKAAFAEELSKFPGGKGTVQFPYADPIPYDLIEKVTRYRLAKIKNR